MTLRSFLERLRAVPTGLAIAYLGVVASLAVLAPLAAPFSPIDQDSDAVLSLPDAVHLLGTDDLGRDILSRLIFGAPVSLFASVLAVSIAVLIGVPLGICAGFMGGLVDKAVSRLIETIASFPGILLAIAVTGALGVGLAHAMIAIGLVFSPELARVARAQTLQIKNELYVQAAMSMGAGTSRILLRHILPNVAAPLLVQVTMLLPTALLVESSLSFLGLGVRPPLASWGAMLSSAFSNMEVAPFLMYPPGGAIVVTAIAFNVLGDAVRRRFEPGR